MEMFLITLVFFSVTIVLMAIGYIIARKKLKGSCGGLGTIMGEDCMFCSKKEECEKNKELRDDCIGTPETK
jgi:uncharacterized protein